MRTVLTKNTSTLRSTITYLNSNGVTNHVGMPKLHAWEYNCWGFTQGILGNHEDFEWVEMSEMEKWLNENTVEVTRLKCGDIVVFRGIDKDECCCYEDCCTCKPELLHTAILVDPAKSIIIHKPGGQAMERCTIDSIGENHGYGEVTGFRRVER